MEAEQLMHYRLVKTNYISEKGKRSKNEDYVLWKSWAQENSLVLIADGMGGYEEGDVAAKTISDSISNYLKTNLSLNSDTYRLVLEALNFANEAISEIKSGNGKKLGATIAGILFSQKTAFCFWLGDVRIIHLRNNQIQFQSKDHSLINELKAQNINIDSENYKRINHIVTRAIQGNPEVLEPEIHIINDISIADNFIICSDGVHNVVGPKEMEQFIQSNNEPHSLIDMIRSNCEMYGDDNYSLVLIS